MEYWVVINDTQEGPMSLDELLSQDLTPGTLVWHAGLESWIPAAELEELKGKFDSQSTEEPDSEEVVSDAGGEDSVETNASSEIPEIPVIPEAGYQEPRIEPEQPQQPCPPTNLVWAILATVLCCIPLGIPAVIFASQVKTKYTAGDYAGAKKASERAAWFTILSIVIGLIYQPFYGLISMLTVL